MAFIRGERPWRDLEPLGLRIAFSDDRCEIQGSTSVVTPTIKDLARGLLNHISDPVHLRQWAAVVLAGSEFIDLKQIERDPQGELIIDALWEASAGDPVPEAAVATATRLAS
jgi:hypothetical protein